MTAPLCWFVPDTFQDACQFGENNAICMIFSFINLFLKEKFLCVVGRNHELRN
uniref:Uncharacterized protein n=1 Tax=Rhizobium rhizogenes TaxID=359 RepID=A0A7S4ZRM2_RHIRH|nr:hypothetical protein pC5.7c_580 [Rhizobium rhizogenes]